MKLSSPAFKDADRIPARYTCDGEDISPALQWSDVPSGTVSYVLIADDPDAPAKTWVHWVMYNIPSSTTEFKENIQKKPTLPEGIIQGLNDSGHVGYDGPCPPSGIHRYFFRLYALDTRIPVKDRATKLDLLHEMEDHVLAQAELMGTYARRSQRAEERVLKDRLAAN